MKRLSLLAACCVLLGGCASAWLLWGDRGLRCPGPLVSTGELPGDFAIRHRVRVTTPRATQSLSLVLEKRGNSLALVALGGFGNKAFELTQTGVATEFQVFPGHSLLHPLAWLHELHRLHFLGVRGGPFGAGSQRDVRDGTAVHEVWREGRLKSRAFEEPQVRLTFDRDVIHIANESCNYKADVRVVSDSRSP